MSPQMFRLMVLLTYCKHEISFREAGTKELMDRRKYKLTSVQTTLTTLVVLLKPTQTI